MEGVDAARPLPHRGCVTQPREATDGITGGTGEGTSASLGVVDPLRVPGADLARGFWDRTPALGRVFLVAAAIDLVLRVSGVGGLPENLDLSAPLDFLLFSVFHYPLLLFPVVVLARRPDAASTTPLILGGAVAIALVELLGPLGLWLSPAGGDITGWTLLQLATAVARGGAYISLAYGLRAVDRSVPTRTAEGLGNLVGGVIALAAIVSILVQLLGPQADLGMPGWNAQVLLAGIGGELATLGFAFLARTAIRGATDVSRPPIATTLAATAMFMTGIASFLTLAFGALLLAQSVFALSAPVLSGGFALWFLGPGVALALLVVAFGLGLGDVSATIPERPLSHSSKESRA